MTLTRFADLLTLSSSRTADPASAGIDRFVGLEHIEPENLHIRSWGNVADGTTFTNTFKRGQVLFGKRRAYQRKVAVADFEGVCSGDIYVFESKDPNVLLPELVPFILQSEGFYQYAVKTSAGSLSPRTNWTHLANYEFPLPPVDEQRRIADLLWAADDLKTNYQLLLNSALTLQSSVLQDSFGRKTELVDLEQWCRNIITYGIVQAGPHIEDGIPYIRVSDMTSNEELTIDGMLRTTKVIAEKYKRSEVRSGDIVVALRGPVGLVRVVPSELNGANLTQGTARVSVKDEFVRDYVLWALRSPVVTQQYSKYSKGSTFSEISLQALRGIKIPMCSVDEQRKIADKMNEVSESIKTINKSIEAAKNMTRQLLTSALS